jgi:hypothetical protein
VRSAGPETLAHQAEGRGGCARGSARSRTLVLAAKTPPRPALPPGPHPLVEPRGHAERVTTLLEPR